MIAAPAHVLEFEAALELLRATGVEAVPGLDEVGLLAARGRVLGEPVLADRDQPPFDRATRDGFAVIAREFGRRELAVAGTVRAGEIWAGSPLAPGTAIEIMTGAPLPEGADAVAMVEHVVRDGDCIRAAEVRTLEVGENVVPRGSEARTGQVLLAPGTAIGAAEIALAAACGRPVLTVRRKVRAAVVATGDELVELDETPVPQQIRNSNSYAIAAMVEAAGAEAVRLPITPDRREAVAASLEQARSSDLIVLSGGVSMGEYDLVEEMLLAVGAEFAFTGVTMQPGKPVVFGRIPASGRLPARLFFGLPGNPVSTQVTFHCFVEPMLRRLAGEPDARPRWCLAELAGDAEGKSGLTRLLPARMDGTQVRVVGWQGSGDLAANARANCYVEVKPEGRAAGSIVRVLLR
jgi:molybdopterin molybdotransferase